MSLIALIPARSGSKRIPNKNIKDFFGHPLMAYTIQVAKDCGLFGEHIYVSSDSDEYLEIAEKYGAIGLRRPHWASGETSPDSEWIASALMVLCNVEFDYYFILRPTNPFRSAEMLKRAESRALYKKANIKAIQGVKQHPYKIWQITTIPGVYYDPDMPYEIMQPVFHPDNHLKQSSSLPVYWIQDGSLEIRHRSELKRGWAPFYTYGCEGFDINTIEDWILAEELVRRGMAKLPEIK